MVLSIVFEFYVYWRLLSAYKPFPHVSPFLTVYAPQAGNHKQHGFDPNFAVGFGIDEVRAPTGSTIVDAIPCNPVIVAYPAHHTNPILKRAFRDAPMLADDAVKVILFESGKQIKSIGMLV